MRIRLVTVEVDLASPQEASDVLGRVLGLVGNAPQPAAAAAEVTSAEPQPATHALPAPKPKRRVQRRPKPESQERGGIRVDTGRRSSQDTLDVVRRHQPVGTGDVGRHLGISPAAASQRLSALLAAGKVCLVSRGVYKIPDAE